MKAFLTEYRKGYYLDTLYLIGNDEDRLVEIACWLEDWDVDKKISTSGRYCVEVEYWPSLNRVFSDITFPPDIEVVISESGEEKWEYLSIFPKEVDKIDCPDEETIYGYLEGDIIHPRIYAEIKNHLSLCPKCREKESDIQRDIEIEEENDDLRGWSYKSLHKEM